MNLHLHGMEIASDYYYLVLLTTLTLTLFDGNIEYKFVAKFHSSINHILVIDSIGRGWCFYRWLNHAQSTVTQYTFLLPLICGA